MKPNPIAMKHPTASWYFDDRSLSIFLLNFSNGADLNSWWSKIETKVDVAIEKRLAEPFTSDARAIRFPSLWDHRWKLRDQKYSEEAWKLKGLGHHFHFPLPISGVKEGTSIRIDSEISIQQQQSQKTQWSKHVWPCLIPTLNNRKRRTRQEQRTQYLVLWKRSARCCFHGVYCQQDWMH